MEYIVISFDSTHAAMATEKYLAPYLPVKIMPTPRAISKACGISIRLDIEHLQKAQELLAKAEKDSFGLYIIDGNGGARQL